MKKIASSLLLIIVFLSLNSCNEKTLIQDMAIFDRLFIPAFYYSYMGDLEHTSMALYVLENEWKKFEPIHQQDHLSDDWNETFRLVGTWLEGARCAIDDRDLVQALFQLDHVRYEMSELRYLHRKDDYYLDYLWDLEGAIGMAKDIANDSLTDIPDWRELFLSTSELRLAWVMLSEQEVDIDLYKINPEKAVLMLSRQSELRESIFAYIHEINNGCGNSFVAASAKMEKAYFEYLKMFGNFEASTLYYAATE